MRVKDESYMGEWVGQEADGDFPLICCREKGFLIYINEVAIRSDCKHQTAPAKRGHQVEHMSRARNGGGAELRNT